MKLLLDKGFWKGTKFTSPKRSNLNLHNLKVWMHSNKTDQLLEELMYSNVLHTLTTDRLAQLVEYRTTVREVVGSKPGQTHTQDL